LRAAVDPPPPEDYPAAMNTLLSRRSLIGSLTTFTLLETLAARDLWAQEVKPIAGKWVADLNDLSRDVRGQKLPQVEWQKKVEELFSRLDPADVMKFLNFEKLAGGVTLLDRGEKSIGFEFPKVEGVPGETVFGKQIFALKKGRSVAPHGHNNMATAFLILKGEFHGRLFDRVKDEPKHMLLKSTVDRAFKTGESSTISDEKDNVHWFEATSETAFIFNIHVTGVSPKRYTSSQRVYVDPEGEKLEGGLMRARLVSHKEVYEKYG
jgi:hypothetical protein